MFCPPRLSLALAPLSAALCLLVFVSTGGAATTIAVQNATVGTQPRDIVVNAAALKPFVEAAKTRRVDIAGVGDSNQVAGPGGAYGWDHGYSKAWSDRYGEYATGVFGMNAEGGWAGPQGYIDSWGYPWGATDVGAPAALDKYKLYYDSLSNGISDFPSTYAYFGANYVETTAHWTPLVTVRKGSPLWGQNLRWQMTYGTFENGNGAFTPSVAAGGVKLLTGGRITTSTGTTALVDSAFKVPAAAYKNAQGGEFVIGLSYSGEGTMRGPFFGLWQRVEGDRTSGISYSTMLWQGGRALVHAATALKSQSDDAIKEYIRNSVKLQDGPKMLLVQVNHGGNDGGTIIPSVGPNPAMSNTPAGFADNMDALISRLRGVWKTMGYDPKNLVFQYGPYHPREGNADDGTGRTRIQRLADWENAIVQLSQQHPGYNLAIVRGTKMTTPRTMDANGWFSSAADHAHLSIDGYVGVSELGVRQVVGYATAEERDNRSGVTSLSFKFNSDVSANLTPDDLVLKEAGSDTLMDPFNFAVDWDASTNTATWTFQGLPMGELPTGDYEAVLRLSQLGALVGSAGSDLASSDYTFAFTADPIPEPAGLGAISLIGFALARRRRR
ncbi:MAG: hypothetical protein QOF78_3041 [Phycisphaerales bacterium]|nr:hypothetical protein [Phycisphaerales bacterium]